MRTTLLIGGARSGKSVLAERTLAGRPRVTYFATASPANLASIDALPASTDTAHGLDPDFAQRVRRHRARRPADWSTIECGASLLESFEQALEGGELSHGSALVVDCLGILMAANLGCREGLPPEEIAALVAADIAEALGVAAATGVERSVLVSNEVGMGVVPATDSGRAFRDALGALNRSVAAVADEASLVVAGLLLPLTSRDPATAVIARSDKYG